MLSENPQIDQRICERTPPNHSYQPLDDCDREVQGGEHPGQALWALYARVKYAAAKQSPRQSGKRSADLRRATEAFREALEGCWRAGYKSEDMTKDLLRLLSASPVALAMMPPPTKAFSNVKICTNCGSSIEA